MELLKFLRYQNLAVVVCILFTLWIARTSAMQLCHHGNETTHKATLDINSSSISGSNGMCSCRVQLFDDARLNVFAELKDPGCSTRVSLSDPSYTFTCTNELIDFSTSYFKEMKAADVLWLFVTSTGVSQVMTGYLQFKTPNSSQFRLECFDANANTSETTPSPATTNTAATTTMSIASTKSTSALKTVTTPTQTLQVSMTTTKSPQMAATTIPSVTRSLSDGPPVSASGSAPANSTPTKEFPVAAVAGGIAGGLLLILIVTLAVVCFRRRNRGPKLLENGRQPSTDQGNDNRAFESDGPTLGEMKPQDIQSPDNTKHVHVENDLYVSADSDHQPHHSQVNLTDSVPGHYASPGDLSIDKSEVESVEGSEIVITSSGDLYAVVDESKKNKDQLVTDPNPTTSLADLFAVVDPTMKHQDELLFDPNPTKDGGYAMVNKKQDQHDIDSTSMVSPSGDVYAVVNKKQDPQDIDPTSMVSPSGDVYAVVNKKQDPQDIDPTSVVSPSGDVYAVVNKKQDPQDIDPTSVVPPSGDMNKKQDPQDFDTTHTFSSFGDVDKKRDSQVRDPNHVTSPSGNVYAVVEKKQEVDQNDHMARTSTDDEEEEAIRRVMDMNDERPSSDTLQSTSL